MPRDDRTRTALCGASVVVSAADRFDSQAAAVCDECAQLASAPWAKSA